MNNQTSVISNIEKTMLVKADKHEEKIIYLNSLDIFEGQFAIQLVLFYKQTLDLEKLKLSLAHMLTDYPIAAGRLVKTENNQFYIQCNNAGIAFVEAQSSLALHDIIATIDQGGSTDIFLDNVNVLQLANNDKPLLSVKLTQLRNEGSILGITFAHCMTDFSGMVNFIDSWAQAQRGNAYAKPDHKRDVLEPEKKPALPVDSIKSIPASSGGFKRVSGWKIMRNIIKSLLFYRDVIGEIFHFSREELDLMKKEVMKNIPGGLNISTNDALTAHLWQVLSLLRGISRKDVSTLLMVANIRNKISPAMPVDYFGNAVNHIITKLSGSVLHNAHLSEVAMALRESINNMTSAHIKEDYRWLRQVQDKGKNLFISGNLDAFKTDFFVSSFIGPPVYDIDFGTGKPVKALLPHAPFPWIIRFMPGPANDGSIDVYLSIKSSLMKKLKTEQWQKKLHMYK